MFYQYEHLEHPNPFFRQASDEEIEEGKDLFNKYLELLKLFVSSPEEFKVIYGCKKKDKKVDPSNLRVGRKCLRMILGLLQKDMEKYLYIGMLNAQLIMKSKRIGITELSLISSYIYTKNDYGKFIKFRQIGAIGIAVMQDEYIPLIMKIEKFTLQKSPSDFPTFPEKAVKVFKIEYNNKIAWLAISKDNKKLKHDPNNHQNEPQWEELILKFKLDTFENEKEGDNNEKSVDNNEKKGDNDEKEDDNDEEAVDNDNPFLECQEDFYMVDNDNPFLEYQEDFTFDDFCEFDSFTG